MPGGRPDERVLAAAGNLRIDAATAEVVAAFESAGVTAILIKGPATTTWLYPDTPRGYSDSDLLVDPAGAIAAGEILQRLGFRQLMDTRSMPAWWQEHASEWWRELDGVFVDLHRTIPGVQASEDLAWSILTRDLDTVAVAGTPVKILSLPGRALHLALHAAHHGSGWGAPVDDLNRAMSTGDQQLWCRAHQLASELDAVDALAAGLRLTEQGKELASGLGLPTVSLVETALRAASPPPVALGFEQLARAGSMSLRLKIVWRKLFPPPAFIRHWDVHTATRVRLVRAYVRRPFWVVRNAPRGWRAWRRARRSVDRNR